MTPGRSTKQDLTGFYTESNVRRRIDKSETFTPKHRMSETRVSHPIQASQARLQATAGGPYEWFVWGEPFGATGLAWP
jgi:hypothetical protein